MVNKKGDYAKIITIDMGTSNTRVSLWDNGKIVELFSYSEGIQKASLIGNNNSLRLILKKSIESLIEKYDLSIEKTIVIASGMISSENGLVEIPHIKGPVGIRELADSTKCFHFKDICSMPIWIIPGVKIVNSSSTFNEVPLIDIMRGEETEVIATSSFLSKKKASVLVMPGTHTKLIKIDDQGKILEFRTTMMGELLSLLTQKSILSPSVNRSFVDKIDSMFILAGYNAAVKNGIGGSLFNVRLLDQFADTTTNQRANYLLGALLSSDIQLLETFSGNTEQIILTGNQIVCGAWEIILQQLPSINYSVKILKEKNLAGLGAVLIAREKGLIKGEELEYEVGRVSKSYGDFTRLYI